MNSEPLNMLKSQITHFWNPQKLISRKIRLIENSLIFYPVKLQILKCTDHSCKYNFFHDYWLEVDVLFTQFYYTQKIFFQVLINNPCSCIIIFFSIWGSSVGFNFVLTIGILVIIFRFSGRRFDSRGSVFCFIFL